jgi:hypothetical protein
MKKIILMLTLFLGVTVVTVAQDEGSGKDGSRIEALKIAYLTKKMNLSTEEAQKFWPIYNKYIDEVRKVRLDARQNQDGEIKTEEKLLNIRKRYNGEFSKALSLEKTNSFFRAEKEFGTFLQKELMERRQQRLDNRRKLRQ